MSLCHHAPPSPSRSISLSSGVLKRPVHRLIITLAFVTVLIGTHNHSQGHETTFAQIVGEKLGVPFENIDIVFGDTDKNAEVAAVVAKFEVELSRELDTPIGTTTIELDSR